MKYVKITCIALAAAMISGFTSCVSNDDSSNSGLTDEEIGECINTVSGTYYGKVYYRDPNSIENVTDSAEIYVEIGTDTTLTLIDFPPSVLASGIQSSTIREAFDDVASVDISGHMYYYSMTPISFFSVPSVRYEVSYGDETHVADFVIGRNYDFYGSYGSNDGGIINIIMGGIECYIDNNESENMSENGNYFLLSLQREL
jgi:hypothetical protein